MARTRTEKHDNFFRDKEFKGKRTRPVRISGRMNKSRIKNNKP